MDVTSLEWTITMVVAIVILVFDVFWIAHRPHEPTIRETALALTFYIALALAFGLYVWLHHGGTYGMEFLPAGSPNTACPSITCLSSS